jgi:hypothetical protein
LDRALGHKVWVGLLGALDRCSEELGKDSVGDRRDTSSLVLGRVLGIGLLEGSLLRQYSLAFVEIDTWAVILEEGHFRWSLR